jgi:hypothetical protein
MRLSVYRWTAALAVSMLVACSGGSSDEDESNPPASGTGTEVPTPSAPPVDQPPEEAEPDPVDETPAPSTPAPDETNGNDVPEDVTPGTDSDATVLMRAGFETSFTGRGPGWVVNYWGTPFPTFEVARETAAAHVRSGTGAQRFRVVERQSGDAHLTYPYGFVNGKTYRAALHLKASAPTTVVVQLRRDAPPWNLFATKTVQLTTAWQRVELEGLYQWNEAGSIRVIAKSTGVNLYLDDVTLSHVNGSDTPIGGLTLPAAGAQSVTSTTVASADMEGSFLSTASGWKVNYWGLPLPSWSVGRETRTGYVHGGTSSQRFRVDSKGGGAVHLTYPYGFAKGRTYRATLYLRADSTVPVEVMMRRDAHPWDAFATKTVTATTSWQKVEITGTYVGTVAGTVRVIPKTLGVNVYVDDLTIADVQYNDLAPANTGPIPDTLFGIHVNKLGSHATWPALGHRLVRLWNTGTTWRDLQPASGVWDFNNTAGRRLDMYVDYVKRNDADGAILYTLGQTPQWASATPGVTGLYGLGASGAPTNMAYWRDYVRTLARRYAGRIRYWELWNEPDYQPHYNGSMATMVEMARIAREELKAADPANQLVSPGATAGQGMAWLNNFLAAGGGQHVDIVGFHWYFDTTPEKIGPMIQNVRQLMANHGIGNKPLWNTEGAPGCDALLYQCSSFVPTPQQQRSVTARALLIMWAKGVSSFSYYFWERADPLSSLVQSDYRTPTDAAHAYAEAARWLRGARLVDGYRIDDSVHVFRVQRGTEHQVILWSTTPGVAVNLPAAWGVGRQRTLMGTETALPSSRQISLGLEPVLLKP